MATKTTPPTPTAPRWVEWVPLDKILEAEDNPKGHATATIEQSFSVHGYVAPIVRDERTGRLVAGHGRLAELRRARDVDATKPPDGVMRDETGGWLVGVWCGWRSVDDEQAAAYLLVDNVATELGGWRRPALSDMVLGLRDAGRLDGSGYTRQSADELFALAQAKPDPKTDPDDVPPEPEIPVSTLGDVWILGDHRLIVGDCGAPGILEALTGDPVDMVWTDPPYGVSYVAGDRALAANERRAAGGLDIDNDDLPPDELDTFLEARFRAVLAAARPGAAWFTASPPGPLLVPFVDVMARLGILREAMVWVKDSLVLGHSDYHYRHEMLLYGWAPGGPHTAPPNRSMDTVWEIPRPKRSAEHPTMKPVALIVRAIENHTIAGGVVLDPFAGSGSTLIAAEQTRRRALVVEQDLSYADVICRRYQEHTGIVPVLEATGEEHSFTTVT